MICLKCDNFADFLIWCRLALALLCVPVRYLFTVSRQLMKQSGYIASLGRTRASSFAAVNYLRNKHWFDRYTAEVTLDFALFNADVNLGCLVQVFWQFPPGGCDSKLCPSSVRAGGTAVIYAEMIASGCALY